MRWDGFGRRLHLGFGGNSWILLDLIYNVKEGKATHAITSKTIHT